MDLMGKKAIWDRIWRLPSGRRSLYLVVDVFEIGGRQGDAFWIDLRRYCLYSGILEEIGCILGTPR